ncbi:Arginyl-tRNA--protein transferase [hydrothermal vent metagenome]|uniref:Arginyl-tRNA--protein transferase n=1 Tax=hydrothermal vent metagenome TaxID=652676 RepID=A0A3B0RY41_9ZZZZ
MAESSKKLTNQSSQFPRFYVTAPTACPYLEGKVERKVFTELNDINPGALNQSLAKIGFRRSQDIAYRPSCENCTECKSVRIPAASFRPNRTQRRLIRINDDLLAERLPNIATHEHYDLLSKYLTKRHAEGGMTNMTFDEYVSMVEACPVDSCLIEYRLTQKEGGPDKLIAVTLTDIMSHGLSMVYSYFDVSDDYKKRSIGTYIILDHVARARLLGLDHVYLGYWVKGSPKMAYKKNFQPLEVLEPEGWFPSDRI